MSYVIGLGFFIALLAWVWHVESGVMLNQRKIVLLHEAAKARTETDAAQIAAMDSLLELLAEDLAED